MVRTDCSETIFVLFDPSPHLIDIIDAVIARENERVQIVLTHPFSPPAEAIALSLAQSNLT